MAIDLKESENFLSGALTGTAGLGLLGAAGYKMAKSVPGGPGKIIADYSHNFLPGFYDKGATAINRGMLAGKEGLKMSGRLASTVLNPVESIAYKTSGIAPYLKDLHSATENSIGKITQEYIEGIKPFQQAQNEIRNIEKQLHFKLTNDYSNSYMYRTQPKIGVKR